MDFPKENKWLLIGIGSQSLYSPGSVWIIHLNHKETAGHNRKCTQSSFLKTMLYLNKQYEYLPQHIQ